MVREQPRQTKRQTSPLMDKTRRTSAKGKQRALSVTTAQSPQALAFQAAILQCQHAQSQIASGGTLTVPSRPKAGLPDVFNGFPSQCVSKQRIPNLCTTTFN